MKVVGKFLVLAVAGVVTILVLRQTNNDRVLSAALQAVSHLDLTEDEAVWTRQYIRAAHPAAFDQALDMSKAVGQQFNDGTYFDVLFEGILDRARTDGQHDLADKLKVQFPELNFSIRER